MKKISHNRVYFYKFLNGEIGKEELETWIYSNQKLENELKEYFYDLISFSFKAEDSKSFITQLVKKLYDYKEYELWRTINLLERISLGNIDIVLASRQLRELYEDQKKSLEKPLITSKLGLSFESILDEYPTRLEYSNWNQSALKKNLNP